MSKQSKLKCLLVELGHHLPFSIFGVSFGLVLMGVLTFISILTNSEEMLSKASYELFHVFHPIHILFSAIATTAMFWKHEKNFIKAIIVGSLGAVVVCSLSDIIFPLIGGMILGADMQIHICVLENPQMILVFLGVGIISGILVPQAIEHSTEYSHAMHVFISSAASILYLLGFGMSDWTHSIGSVFLIMIIAVMIPCCVSDIVFPLACAHNDCGCEKDCE